MHPDPKHRHKEEEDDLGETSRRSIFSEWWFRGLLIVIALAVVVVIALPYVLDWWTQPPPTPLQKAQIPPPPPPLPGPQVEKAEAPKAPPAQVPATPEPTPSKLPSEPPQSEAKATAKPEAKAAELARERPKAAASVGGNYWIQVGAFNGQANAAALAARLVAEGYPARRFSLARPAGGTHEVFVVGASNDEVTGKLRSKEYRAEAVGPDVVIRPALPLREAVNLSKELASQGLTVKIRRSSSAETFHVVRVGGYPDRQHAQAVQKDLANKGFPGFIVKGTGQ